MLCEMSNSKPINCPYCAMSLAAGTTSCPSCGGFVPDTGDDDGRPSGAPGGQGFASPPIPSSDIGAPPSGGGFGPPPSGGGYGAPASPPNFGSAPHMAPAAVKTGGAGKIVVIFSLVVVLLVVAGVVAALSFTRSGAPTGASNGPPPELIAVNHPVTGMIGTSPNHKIYEFVLTRPGQTTISLNSTYDNYLELYRENEDTAFREDDDSGNGLNAMITAFLQPGIYYVLARPYSDGTTGSFTLAVNAAGEGLAGGSPPLVPPGIGTPPAGVPGMPTAPFFPPNSSIVPQNNSGVVAVVSGPAPVTAGTQCTVFIQGNPRTSSLNCRIRVACGSNIIYGRDTPRGSYGFSRCMARIGPAGQQILEAHDTTPTAAEGDPRMDLDTGAGHVIISDDTPTGTWSVTIRFGNGSVNPPVPAGPHTST